MTIMFIIIMYLYYTCYRRSIQRRKMLKTFLRRGFLTSILEYVP